MSGIITCGCPVTKTLTVAFTGSTPAPASGYIVKWAIPNGAWNYVTPNPTSSPVTINNVPACENISVVVQSQCDNSQVSSEVTATATGNTLYDCGDTITGSNTHNGLYTYTPYILDVRAATSEINLSYDVIDRPNRIRVFDDNNNEVANSDWRGVAAYPYTWGATLNTPTTGIVNFTKTAGKCFYKMVVESYTNISTQDSWTVNISCPTTVTPVTPTITYESCSNGYGQYRIDAPAGTVLKLSLSATDSLINNSTTGSCARIDGNITSSTGPTASAVSGVIVSSGTATLGAANALFVSVTVPGTGYLVVNTTVDIKNSPISESVSALLKIFEVNGSTVNIMQSVCVTSSSATVSCGVSTNYQYSAVQCSNGLTVTIVTSSLNTINATYKGSNSPISECYTILTYLGFTNQTPTHTLFSTVSGCGSSQCVQL
jgi:hypothetical protein